MPRGWLEHALRITSERATPLNTPMVQLHPCTGCDWHLAARVASSVSQQDKRPTREFKRIPPVRPRVSKNRRLCAERVPPAQCFVRLPNRKGF